MACSDWRDQAACAGEDPRLWDTPEHRGATVGERMRVALNICGRCPVVEPCKAAMPDPVGVIRGGEVYDEDGHLEPVKWCAGPGCRKTVLGRRPHAIYCSKACNNASGKAGRGN